MEAVNRKKRKSNAVGSLKCDDEAALWWLQAVSNCTRAHRDTEVIVDEAAVPEL